MRTLTLTQKRAPRHLSDIYGQEEPRSYFQAVVKNPAYVYRNYVITGPAGTGKTSIVKAFANDLLGVEDASLTPNYIELDSYQVQDRNILLGLKDSLFQEVPGYKVVLLDEWHLVDLDVQAGLLKDIETSTLPIFFFFASTERKGILDTIFSRSLDFSMTLFTPTQLQAYLENLLTEEGLAFGEAAREAMVLRSFGHLRNLINQVELAIVMGEEQYLVAAGGVLRSVEEFFKQPGRPTIDVLTVHPFSYVQESMDYFIHERLIKGRELFGDGDIPKVFTFYLKYKRYIQDANDFFSFLSIFSDYLKSMRPRSA